MAACERHRARLGAYLDGELTDSVRLACERHLAECPACQTAFDELKGLNPMLRTLGEPPVPSGLTSMIMARAAEKRRSLLPAFVRDLIWELRATSWLDRSLTTASLCAVLMLGGFMGWTSHQTDHHIALQFANESVPSLFDAFGTLPAASIEAATLDLFTHHL